MPDVRPEVPRGAEAAAEPPEPKALAPARVTIRGGWVSPRARVIPLAVLLAVIAVVVAVRLRAGKATRASAASVSAPSASSSESPPERAAAPPQAPFASGLGAALAASPGKVTGRPRMLHEDARHTHRAKGRAPRAAKLAWSFAVAGGVSAQVTASPDGQTLYVASLDGTVTALTRAGAKKWSAALGDRVYATPAVGDDGVVYVGTDAKSFVALTPEGRIKWRLETDGEADTGASFTKDGSLVFAAGKTVYQVRPGGDVAWRFHAKKKVFAAPAIAEDGTIVFGSHDDHAYALKPSGALLWKVDLGADVDGAPAIGDDGAIFFGTDAGEVVRLKPTGEIVWRAKLGGYVRGTLSVARNGDVLAGVYGPQHRAVRLAPDDGALRGALAVKGTGAKDFGVHGGALEDDDGALLFGAQDDAVYAVEPSGAVRWRFAAAGDVDAPITLLEDGSVVFASDDGEGGRVYFLAAE